MTSWSLQLVYFSNPAYVDTRGRVKLDTCWTCMRHSMLPSVLLAFTIKVKKIKPDMHIIILPIHSHNHRVKLTECYLLKLRGGQVILGKVGK